MASYYLIKTLFGFPTIWFWAYLVIPETHCADQIWYLRFYYYHWVDTPASELLVPEGIVHPIVSVSAPTSLIGNVVFYLKFTASKNAIIV